MDVGQMSAEQVELALERVQGGWDMLHELGEDRGRDHLLELEGRLKARQAVVGKPLRGVSLDLALAGDRDSLRQAAQHCLAAIEEGLVDSSRLHEALRRSDELGAKWEPREVEAVELARQNEGLRFELTVAHGGIRDRRGWQVTELAAARLELRFARSHVEAARSEADALRAALKRIVDAKAKYDAPDPIGMTEFEAQIVEIDAAIRAAAELLKEAP